MFFEKYWYLLLIAAFILFLLVVVLRAAFYVPPKKKHSAGESVSYDTKSCGEHLSEMIKLKTIADRDSSKMDWAVYKRFPELIAELYPNAAKQLSFETAGETGLIYHWRGKSSDMPSVLMAHYDVVPANADEWSFDPFGGEIKDGIIHGRGTLDTKSTLCAAFEAVDRLCSQCFVPDNDIYLCFSGSEEIAGEGAYAIVELLEKRGIKPVFTLDEGGAIVSGAFPGVKQPTAVVGISEKGQMAVRLSVKSGAGHASAPPKETALAQLSRAVCALDKHQFKAKLTPPAKLLFKTLGRYSSFGLKIIFGNLGLFTPLLQALARSLGNDLNALMRTTYVFTMAQGSAASNVLPSEASVTCDVRLLSNCTSDELLAHFKKVINNDNIVIEPIFCVEASPCSPAAGRSWDLLEASVNETWDTVIVSPYLMMARSDSSVYTKICDNVYRFAPMELSKEERATIHGIDEKIPEVKLAKAAEFYHRLIKKL